MSEDMPDWPAAMDARLAMRYVSIKGLSTFYALGIKARRHTPKGDRLWLRADLDAYLLSLPVVERAEAPLTPEAADRIAADVLTRARAARPSCRRGRGACSGDERAESGAA